MGNLCGEIQESTETQEIPVFVLVIYSPYTRAEYSFTLIC